MISKRFHLLRALLLLFACSVPESVAEAAHLGISDESYDDLSRESEQRHHFHARNHKKADFSDLASPSESNDLVLDHSRINEGEVYLFKNRKHRHRAIPVIRTGSRFNDALTFKDWMKNATKSRDKVVKIVLRNTDVVRPVLQYLYAAQDDFESPILLHANVFRLAGTYDKTVDPLILIGSAQKMLPDATISLGWNDPKNITELKSSQKRISWRSTFHMLNYINHISQPLILSMRLSLAQNSVDQLLWILGMNQTISVVVWSDDQDDENIEWYQILRLRSYAGKNKVIFDLLPKHRDTLEKKGRLPTRKDDQIDATWLEMHELSSARPVLSKTFQSDRGIAFLGWSNSFLLAKKSGNEEAGFKPMYYSGKVLFLPKKGLKHISPLEDSGLSLQLVDREHVSESGDAKSGIQILIGYDGRVFLENMDPDLEQSYNQRSSGRVQHYVCYGFSIVDRGWRVEVDVWTDFCEGYHIHPLDPPSLTSLQLETPIRSRTPRSVMISKSGDGEIDFLIQKLARSGSSFNSVISLAVLGLASLLYFSF